MVTHSDVKVLLVQLRIDAAMQAQERLAVCRSGHILPAQVTTVNGLEHTINIGDLDNYNMLLVGGTGDYSIFDRIRVKKSLLQVMKYAREINYPILGSCWGGQLLAQMFGGKVETLEARSELGSYEIHPTPYAEEDPLFYDAPDDFWAQLGHHESIVKLPKNAVGLLSSNNCPVQAFTWPGSAQYGLQLHSDLSKAELVERVTHYRANYAAEQGAFDAFLATLQESPYTDNLVAKFVFSELV
jgi:GMP synthase (glutamine-hydrolysing)